jgi:hypothetical protein
MYVCIYVIRIYTGQDQTHRRNADMHEIARRCIFKDSKKGLITPVPLAPGGGGGGGGGSCSANRNSATSNGYAPYRDALRSGAGGEDFGGEGGVGKSLLVSTADAAPDQQLPFW